MKINPVTKAGHVETKAGSGKWNFGVISGSVALAVTLALCLSACSRTDPQAALNAAAGELQTALEARDVSKALDLLHQDFVTEQTTENGRDWAKRTMAMAFMRYKNVNIVVLKQTNFELTPGFLVVTFKFAHGFHGETTTGQESGQESLEHRILQLLAKNALSRGNLVKELGLARASGRLNRLIPLMLIEDTIEYTLPEKPNSRLQKYRITAKGRKVLKTRGMLP